MVKDWWRWANTAGWNRLPEHRPGNIPLTATAQDRPTIHAAAAENAGAGQPGLDGAKARARGQTAAYGQFLHGRTVRAAGAAAADGHDREQPREHDDGRLQGRAAGDARTLRAPRRRPGHAAGNLVRRRLDATARLFDRAAGADRKPARPGDRGRGLLRGADRGWRGLYPRRSLRAGRRWAASSRATAISSWATAGRSPSIPTGGPISISREGSVSPERGAGRDIPHRRVRHARGAREGGQQPVARNRRGAACAGRLAYRRRLCRRLERQRRRSSSRR